MPQRRRSNSRARCGERAQALDGRIRLPHRLLALRLQRPRESPGTLCDGLPLEVSVACSGRTGYWEDPGIENGGWTELGYAINGNRQVPNSRAVFSGVTPAHYGYAFYSITSKDDPGKLLETDSCDKDR
jgi:hypothetical protein